MEENQVLGVIDSGILSYKLSDVQSMLNESLLGDFGILDDDQGLETNMTAPHYEPYEKRLSTYIMPTIFALIFLIGVLGNGCLILIFFRHRSMRNIPNTWVALRKGTFLIKLWHVQMTCKHFSIFHVISFLKLNLVLLRTEKRNRKEASSTP